MTGRHRLRADDWGSVLGRLEELVLAHSGEDDFVELTTLLVAKAFADRHDPAAFPDGEQPDATADRLAALLARVEAAWPGALPAGPALRLTAGQQAVCARLLAPLRLDDPTLEALDAGFEGLVARSAKGRKGQFFTPRHVVEAVVRCLGTVDGETVADPACGSGALLLHAVRHAERRGAGVHAVGSDFDERAVRVARAMAAVAGDGVPAAEVRRADSLAEASDPAVTGLWDAVVTNPPFAGEVRDPALLDGFELAAGRDAVERDVLFLERVVRGLRPGGRLGIVLPDLLLSGKRHAPVRRWLRERVDVLAVVGLHRHTFQPHTHQKTAVLVGRRRAEGGTAPPPILFAVAERAGKDAAGRPVARSPEAIDAWHRLDHDLDEAVAAVGAHLRTHAPDWPEVEA